MHTSCAGHLCQETAHDPLLSKVLLFKMNGWFRTGDPEFATIEDNSGAWMSDMGNQNHRARKTLEMGILIFTASKMNILIFLSNVQYRWTQNLQTLFVKRLEWSTDV